MIFHISMPARDPALVAQTLASLIRGQDFAFHPISGARIVLLADEHGSAIEVYPDDVELAISRAMLEARRASASREWHATHAAVGTPLSEDEILTICARAGWAARKCDRGPFELIEVWVEDRFLIELLTPDMQDDYRRSMTPENWERW